MGRTVLDAVNPQLHSRLNLELADAHKARQFTANICAALGYVPARLEITPYWKIDSQQQVYLVLPLHTRQSLQEAVSEVRWIAAEIAPQGWEDTPADREDEVHYEMILDAMEGSDVLKWAHLQLIIEQA